MKREDNKLIFIQAIVLLGVIGYLLIDSGILGASMKADRGAAVSSEKPSEKEKTGGDGDVESLLKYSQDIREDLDVIGGEVEVRRRELGNVSKLLSHYRNSVREDHEALASVRREIQKLDRLRKKLKNKIVQESAGRLETRTRSESQQSSASLKTKFADFSVQDRRWRGRAMLAISTGFQIEEETTELDAAVLGQLQLILEGVRNAGVSEVLVARPSVGESGDFNPILRARIAELFGPGIVTKFVNTASVIEKPQLDALEVWLPIDAARSTAKVGSL